MSNRGDIIRGAGGYLNRNNQLGIGIGQPHGGEEGDIRVQMVDSAPRLYARAGGQWYQTALAPAADANFRGIYTFGSDTSFIKINTDDRIITLDPGWIDSSNPHGIGMGIGTGTGAGVIISPTGQFPGTTEGKLHIISERDDADLVLDASVEGGNLFQLMSNGDSKFKINYKASGASYTNALAIVGSGAPGGTASCVGIGTEEPIAPLHVKYALVSDSTPIMLLESTEGTNESSPDLKFYRNSSSPADDDYIGHLVFTGNNDAGTPEEVDYAHIFARIEDTADGDEDGALLFRTKYAGGNSDTMFIMGKRIGINDTTPDATLDVEANENDTWATYIRQSNSGGFGAYISSSNTSDGSVFRVDVGGGTYDTHCALDVNYNKDVIIPHGNLLIESDQSAASATESLTVYGDTESDAISWAACVKNDHNANVSDEYGVGIKWRLGSQTETNKWSGIAAVNNGGWANYMDMLFYVDEAEKMRLNRYGHLSIGTTVASATLTVQDDATDSIPLNLRNHPSGSGNSNNDTTSIIWSHQDSDDPYGGYSPVKIGTKITNAASRVADFFIAVADSDNVDLASDIRLTVASTSQVGIGGTPANNNAKLQVFAGTDSGPHVKVFGASSTGARASITTYDGSGYAAFYAYDDDATSYVKTQIGHADGTKGLVVDAVNNRVGIGTASPTFQLDVEGSSSSWLSEFHNTSTATDSDGIRIKLSMANNSATSSGYWMGYYDEGGIEGGIRGVSGNGVDFDSISDRRLKDTIVDIPDALSIIAKFKPRNYYWKSQADDANKQLQYGFIADEFEEVFAYSVSGKRDSDGKLIPDALKDDGSIYRQMMDQNKFTVPVLVKAVQELMAKVTALESA